MTRHPFAEMTREIHSMHPIGTGIPPRMDTGIEVEQIHRTGIKIEEIIEETIEGLIEDLIEDKIEGSIEDMTEEMIEVFSIIPQTEVEIHSVGVVEAEEVEEDSTTDGIIMIISEMPRHLTEVGPGILLQSGLQ